MVGTLPGRTQGLGLITEPLLRDLRIDRVAFAEINLVATLLGSLFCLGIGRLVDRLGARLVLTVTRPGSRNRGPGDERRHRVRAPARARDPHPRPRAERPLGGEPDHGGQVVLAPAERGHGGLRGGDEHRLHDRVPRGGLGGVWRGAGGRRGRESGSASSLGLAPLAWIFVRRTPEACGLEVDGEAPPRSPSQDPVAAAPAPRRRAPPWAERSAPPRSGCSPWRAPCTGSWPPASPSSTSRSWPSGASIPRPTTAPSWSPPSPRSWATSAAASWPSGGR